MAHRALERARRARSGVGAAVALVGVFRTQTLEESNLRRRSSKIRLVRGAIRGVPLVHVVEFPLVHDGRAKMFGNWVRESRDGHLVRRSNANARGGHDEFVARLELVALAFDEFARARELAAHALHRLEVRGGGFGGGGGGEPRFRYPRREKTKRCLRRRRRGSTRSDVALRDVSAALVHVAVVRGVAKHQILVPRHHGFGRAVLTHDSRARNHSL